MRKFIVYIAIIILLASLASAQTGSIKLLAVSETPQGMVGSMADLHLDIQKGTGRIFIDTLPASKLDTQITTRFARDMACKYLKIDCTKYDFFYTIKADSTIIGGPSAGGATAILTISLLGNIKLDESTVITGTINSGYLFGSVGGVRQKIDAAADAGLKKVLIPETEVSFEENNTTIDYLDYGKEKNITVARVADIDEALREFTGKEFRKNNRKVDMDPSYSRTMAMLADELCNRSSIIRERVLSYKIDRKEELGIFDEKFMEMEGKANNLTEYGKEAYNNGKYYSAASYCFGANVNYHYLLFRLSNITSGEMADMIEKTDREIESLNMVLNSYQIETMTDLQAYIVSKQRLVDAADYLNKTIDDFREQDMGSVYMNLAYSIERIYSASSWSRFLGKDGKEFDLEEDDVRESCLKKVNEAEEYFQYIQLIFPGLMSEVAKEITKAEKDYKDGNYGLCLHKASLAKAEVSIVLSTIGFKEENLQKLLDMKLNAAKKIIIEQQENGIFPIVGYSYYEYAQSLRNESIYSALLYSEYSLELSNLDIYFKPKTIKMRSESFDYMLIFLAGVIVGIAAIRIFSPRKGKPKHYVPNKIARKTPNHKKIKFKFRKK